MSFLCFEHHLLQACPSLRVLCNLHFGIAVPGLLGLCSTVQFSFLFLDFPWKYTYFWSSCLPSCIPGFCLNFSVSYLWSMSYLLGYACSQRAILPANVWRGGPTRGPFPFILSCRTFLHLFPFINTKAIRIQQSTHQVTYKSLRDELFCLAGLLQGAGEAGVDKKLVGEPQVPAAPTCQWPTG